MQSSKEQGAVSAVQPRGEHGQIEKKIIKNKNWEEISSSVHPGMLVFSPSLCNRGSVTFQQEGDQSTTFLNY